tara:strand:+ start:6823 stop:7179 length:357 start_codon:yes stop_codon:yes gene_type:complete
MKSPVIADNKPVKAELTKGEEYYFCTCGKSKSQPFCDGSHAGTGSNRKALSPKRTVMLTFAVASILTTFLFAMALINSSLRNKLGKKALKFTFKRLPLIYPLQQPQPKNSLPWSLFTN